MGYFSWNCEYCHESLKSVDCEAVKVWQTRGVAILKDGSVIRGVYDGFGRIGDIKVTDESPTIYHESCWTKQGEPTVHQGESEGAEDQGYFVPSCSECGCNMEHDPNADICAECDCDDNDEVCDICHDYIEDCWCDENDYTEDGKL